jgi:hypothetical protein
MEEIPTEEEVLAGMFFLNEHPVIILFDSRASHDFISSTCAKKVMLSMCHTPFREIGNEASIRVPRMFKSHAWQQYDKQMQCY